MPDDTVSSQPLDGIRVLDCTQVIAGPFATQMLSDLGAEVVKIERPETGDISRSIEPSIGDSEITSYFASLNRGKYSVELDLSTPVGEKAFKRLAEKADVIVENYRPMTMENWGLDYNSLQKYNEDLIYCSISGFLKGPYRELPAFDMVVQALSGSMSVTGEDDGPPLRPGLPIGDICAGMYAVIGITTALYTRDKTGGQYIEVPMYEGLVSWLTTRAGRSFVTEEPYPRQGTVHPSLAPYRAFETSDGWLTVAIASQDTWHSFCSAINRRDLLQDSRFHTNTDRVENREELARELKPILRQQSSDRWFNKFLNQDVPAAPIKNTLEVFKDRQLDENDLLCDISIDGVHLPFVQTPLQFSEAKVGNGCQPPELGSHSTEILSEIFTEDELEDVLG